MKRTFNLTKMTDFSGFEMVLEAFGMKTKLNKPVLVSFY